MDSGGFELCNNQQQHLTVVSSCSPLLSAAWNASSCDASAYDISCTSLSPFGNVAFEPGLPLRVAISSSPGEIGVGVGECSEDEAPEREEEACNPELEGMMTVGGFGSPHAHYVVSTSLVTQSMDMTHLGVDRSGGRGAFPLVLAVCALRRRSALLLDLEQRSIGMCASRNTVALDASRARELLLVDQDHLEQLRRCRAGREEDWRKGARKSSACPLSTNRDGMKGCLEAESNRSKLA